MASSCPGTTATEPELVGIGRAMGKVGHGVFELTTDFMEEWDEFGWMGALEPRNRAAHRLHHVAIAHQANAVDRANGSDAVRPMTMAPIWSRAIGLRGIGVIMNWRGTVHPFMRKPSWQTIAGLVLGRTKGKAVRPGVQGGDAGGGQFAAAVGRYGTVLHAGNRCMGDAISAR